MDSPAGDRPDESSLTPWDTMDPDEPAAVSVAAPCPVDDQGEALVYRAPEDPGGPEESTANSDHHAFASEQSSSREAADSEPPLPIIPVATEARTSNDAEPLATDSDSLLRYSGGGLGWGPSSENVSTTEPPPQPSPGVPEEGEERGAGANLFSVDETSNPNLPSSHVRGSRAEEIAEDEISDERRDDELDQVCEDPELEHEPEPMLTGASWTIPMLCAGIGLIACCIIIPQADSNRRLAYEKQMLHADLESVERQVTVNGEFLNRVVDDPALSERLAQRQLKRVRKGQRVLQLKEDQPEMSPFQITNIAPPAAPPPYKPAGGIIAGLCYDARTRLYLMGAALTMIAGGLVLGSGARQPRS